MTTKRKEGNRKKGLGFRNDLKTYKLTDDIGFNNEE